MTARRSAKAQGRYKVVTGAALHPTDSGVVIEIYEVLPGKLSEISRRFGDELGITPEYGLVHGVVLNSRFTRKEPDPICFVHSFRVVRFPGENESTGMVGDSPMIILGLTS